MHHTVPPLLANKKYAFSGRLILTCKITGPCMSQWIKSYSALPVLFELVRNPGILIKFSLSTSPA